MSSPSGGRRKELKEAREDLRRIIDTCRSVEIKGLDPYLVDVDDLIKVIRDYFPLWNDAEDLCLDAEALNRIASVVKMQGEWVKRRATALYRDPFLIEEKTRSLPIDKMAEIFLKAWRPITELEQLTLKGFREALKYWSGLPPLNLRWQKVGYTKTDMGFATREEMIKEGVLLGEPFMAELEKMWLELKDLASRNGRIKYWDFVGSDTYEETVRRAYLTSFLITYGYASLRVHFLENEIFILPNEKPLNKGEVELISFPISISFEEWEKWREGKGA
ncbi:MAG: hypothetical protein N3E47_06325 [Candidatus Bathyarchaeota archaeon]|nr:hypothetical protein [Candidatus Bathyarchaeota archaeon]